MQSIPFRLFVVNELDLQDADRSRQYIGHPLGVVDESECLPLWTSKPSTSYPQELGLILLSGPLTTIKSLRLTVALDRAPSQINISTATPTRQGSVSDRRSLDAVSRYLSAEWKPCCKPLVWEACSWTTLGTAEEIDRVVSLNIRDCSYIKLIVHAPHENSRNQSHQVVLQNIELVGTTEDLSPSRAAAGDNDATSHVFGRIHRPALLSPVDDNGELQAVLLDAGISMDLVAQLASTPEATMSTSFDENCITDNSEMVPELSSQDKESVTVPNSTTSFNSEANDNEDRELPSPFDSLLRQYVEQTARERAVLEDILDTKLCECKYDVSAWQSPTISPTDPANTTEITLYTFGAFFTQCLLCGGPDIQVICVQMAERSARLLRQVIGVTPAFEGIVALITLAIREAESSQVFQAAIHLAHTVFLTEITNTKSTASQPQSLASESGVSSTNNATLGLIEDISRANWSYGLRIILERSLANLFCWSITSHGGKPTIQPNTSSRRFQSSFRLANAPPSIDRGFLQFIRLLIEQDLTRASFFDELLDLDPVDRATESILAANRLRLLRLVLRNEIIRCQLSTNVSASIESLCRRIIIPTSTVSEQGDLSRGADNDLPRLASECLTEISRTNPSVYQIKINKTYTKSLRKHVEDSNNPNSHHSHHHRHTALFSQDPFTNAETAKFATHLQRYFSLQSRPNALYRHSFVRACKTTAGIDGEKNAEMFRKGNIAFQGHVIARTPPSETFHDKIQQNTAPFVFDIGPSISKKKPTSHLAQPVHQQQVVSSFATFRGIIEQRSDPPKRSSKKVSPAENVQTTLTTPTTRAAVKTAATSTVELTTGVASSPVDNTVPVDTDIVTNLVHGMSSAPDSTPANQLLLTSSSLSSHPGEVLSVVEQAKSKPDDTTQLNSAKSFDQPKSQKKDKGKEKPKGKQGSKDPENCVLQ